MVATSEAAKQMKNGMEEKLNVEVTQPTMHAVLDSKCSVALLNSYSLSYVFSA
jgi:hypothetical protein